jgi:hypothetical protein
MKTNICDVCLATDKVVKLISLRMSFSTSVGKHTVDLCKEHQSYFDEHGFKKLTSENEAEFYKFLTDLMHNAQQNYHQITHHPTE